MPFADPGYCLAASDWNEPPADYAVQPAPLVVKVESVKIDSYDQTP